MMLAFRIQQCPGVWWLYDLWCCMDIGWFVFMLISILRHPVQESDHESTDQEDENVRVRYSLNPSASGGRWLSIIGICCVMLRLTCYDKMIACMENTHSCYSCSCTSLYKPIYNIEAARVIRDSCHRWSLPHRLPGPVPKPVGQPDVLVAGMWLQMWFGICWHSRGGEKRHVWHRFDMFWAWLHQTYAILCKHMVHIFNGSMDHWYMGDSWDRRVRFAWDMNAIECWMLDVQCCGQNNHHPPVVAIFIGMVTMGPFPHDALSGAFTRSPRVPLRGTKGRVAATRLTKVNRPNFW